MARQLRAEQTRAAIIAAAAELFDRRGYESTSLSDIVDHAQVTKGALYFHFAAKQDLAHAIVELQCANMRRLTEEMDRRGCTALEALIRCTFGMARLSLEGPVPSAGLRLATGGLHLPPELPHPFTQCLAIATHRLRDAVNESDLHPDIDVDAAAHSLVCSLVGTRVVGHSLEPATRHPRRLAELWHILIRGMVPVPRRARYLSLVTQLERELRTV
ncbi:MULTISPECIES: ScbR family autoregulator-binding transcription factor [unclassified Streptomyces]|uniref:ScbR family autoregulator-binding transcription factor n=1 Tax=unclassified Streptomyces TaxID=2593676 RepID=UPI0036E89516